jgi:hypothetical protein
VTQYHVALGQKKPGPNDITLRGLGRTAALGLVVLAGLVAYGFVAVKVTALLHLEGESAYWMSAGVLCLLAVLLGWARHLRTRGMTNWGERAIALYVLAIGLGMFGFGLWRQRAFDAARRRCLEALAAADDVHQRLRVYRTIESLPTLSKGGAERTMTCERLVHS